MVRKTKIAFGGGCHWCTEAVFQSLIGVYKVEQGFIASTNKNNTLSEAVIVHFNPNEITLEVLIEIHLYTHKSASQHSMRKKYRSGIYIFSKKQELEATQVLAGLQKNFDQKIITQVLDFIEFKPSDERLINYYYSNSKKPFCKKFINPKLKLLLANFSKHVNINKLNHTTILL